MKVTGGYVPRPNEEAVPVLLGDGDNYLPKDFFDKYNHPIDGTLFGLPIKEFNREELKVVINYLIAELEQSHKSQTRTLDMYKILVDRVYS